MDILQKIASSPERMQEFQRERLVTEVQELICEVMDTQGVSQAELARRLGKSPPYVSKLLRGGSNMTLRTISDIFHALSRTLRVVDRPLSLSSPRLLVMEISQDETPVRTCRFDYSTDSTLAEFQMDLSVQDGQPQAA
ncbi:hypothetical protein BH23PLA1_BH23PLA1_24570 [soil metagenome]